MFEVFFFSLLSFSEEVGIGEIFSPHSEISTSEWSLKTDSFLSGFSGKIAAWFCLESMRFTLETISSIVTSSRSFSPANSPRKFTSRTSKSSADSLIVPFNCGNSARNTSIPNISGFITNNNNILKSIQNISAHGMTDSYKLNVEAYLEPIRTSIIKLFLRK